MISRLKTLLELIRFSHTIFALPFALMSAMLAWHLPQSIFRWQDLAGIVLCMVFARSAAMAFNRLVDQDIDTDNPRTAGRHLPAGLISRRAVIIFTVVCSVAFVASTLIFLPRRLPITLAVPVLAFLMSYSYAKRFTALCHYWLSTALMLSPIAAWIAVCDAVAWPPVLLATVVFFWVGGFDIIYACQDAQYDQQKRLHSIPAKWGVAGALRIAFASHFIMIICLFAVWSVADLGTVFLCGVVFVAVLLAWQHWLVRPDDLTRVNIAFFNANAIISVGLLIVAAADLWLC